MKLGLVSAILDGWSFEEMIDTCSEMGFKCVEVACWPNAKAERRYAGVSHIDVDNTSDEYVKYVKDYCAKKNVEISSLAFYPNTMDGNLEKRNAAIEHLRKVINMSSLLGVNMVTTFIGRDQTKTVEENIEIFKEVWPPIIKYAEEKGVKVGIENCPMLFGKDQWPGGQNLMTSPVIFRKLFEIIPSKNFGINFDPSHFIWQQMDYIAPLYEFKDRIFHIHCKDIKVFPDKLKECGIMAFPLDYMSPVIPGHGDVNWSKYISALADIQYDSFVCIEVEDWNYESSKEKILDSIRLSKKYLEQYVI